MAKDEIVENAEMKIAEDIEIIEEEVSEGKITQNEADKKISKDVKDISEEVEELEEAEEQLEEMEAIVEDREEKEEEKVSKEADKTFKVEEGRVERTPQEARELRYAKEAKEKLDNWVPKTQMGRMVRAGKIKNIDEALALGTKIMEPQIVDILIPNLVTDTLFIGQSKGKFGGGKRRAFRQTQKKTKEGNVLTFGVMAVVGDQKGHIGIGYGRAAETLPARDKAVRKAKLNIMKIRRGCASFDCSCDEPHSVPATGTGKCSSVVVTLIPAPQGTGLVVNDELKKILRAAGISDVYSKTFGKLRTTFNAGKACIKALESIGEVQL